MAEELNHSLEYTPTWIVAVVCCIIVFISLCVERALHKLGNYLKRKGQKALYEVLTKLEEELMLLGFISLLLTVFQGLISEICISPNLATQMLPCKRPHRSSEGSAHYQIYYDAIINRRRLLSSGSGSDHCTHKMREWKVWEDYYRDHSEAIDKHEFFKEKSRGHWRKAAVISWLMSFFKQFHGSVTKYDYYALRYGFIKKHHSNNLKYNFHNYMLRTLEVDFKRVVGISWYLWVFVVLFLLLNIEGWHTYFWLAFLPLILLLLVGAKLEHIIARLYQDSVDMLGRDDDKLVKPSDEYFWFTSPLLVLHLLHFILFQNSFEIAFFFWIWCTYGFDSCIMEKVAYVIPRLIMGVIVQVLCSYSTLPLYTIVTQMGSEIKPQKLLSSDSLNTPHSNCMIKESTQTDEQAIIMVEDATSAIELVPLEKPNTSNS
ncbi:MLO-like protein 13 isoform X2 [Vigna radiata var. radiata]|uniref:MLO-like protein n=1 Tax=Vigna radiata var. radiata TaxID=3916 RepID=A0A3Q0FIT1_VIGRR|nr:MLO-like protein 13 isoform X2 [Vigna radiata var. radiata]